MHNFNILLTQFYVFILEAKHKGLFLRLYSPLKKHTTCLSCNKALNVSSLDWSQG